MRREPREGLQVKKCSYKEMGGGIVLLRQGLAVDQMLTLVFSTGKAPCDMTTGSAWCSKSWLQWIETTQSTEK